MGQYYIPVILHKDRSIKTSFYSHAYGNGLKLMEHSYVDNLFMRAVEAELFECPQPIIWAGDYADLDEDGTNHYHRASEAENKITDMLKELSFFVREGIKTLVAPLTPLEKSAKYIVNEDTHEFVEVGKSPPVRWSGDDSPLHIHPLSLMTCNSNGRGGGDFMDKDPNGLVGRWAGATIRTTNDHPGDRYAEIIFDLTEE